MKYLGYFFRTFFSDLFLIPRLLCGVRVKFNLISLVNCKAALKTKKEKIRLGKLTVIRANAEICAGNGEIFLKGTYIGDNCVAAAGTVVKGFVEQNSNIYSEHNQIEKRYK